MNSSSTQPSSQLAFCKHLTSANYLYTPKQSLVDVVSETS